MAKCLRCGAESAWLQGRVALTINDIKLTPRQLRFVRAVMDDYGDVTTDNSIRRDARAVRKKIDAAMVAADDRAKEKP